MLIYFKVKNFKSIKDELYFTSECSANKEHFDSTFLCDEKRFNKIEVFFGSNASGKSNIFKALEFMKNFILYSFKSEPTSNIYVTPFCLDNDSKNESSFFEVCFINNGVKYLYNFECNYSSIISENLYYYPNMKKALVFSREKNNKFIFGNSFKFNDLVEKTSKNKLFLVVATTWNNNVAKEVFDWFSNKLIIKIHGKYNNFYKTNVDDDSLSTYLEDIKDNLSLKKDVLRLLNNGDLNIKDILIEKSPIYGNSLSEFPNDKSFFYYKATLVHEFNNVLYNIDYYDESEGTKALLNIASLFYDVIKNDKTLFIDEFDNSLHPLLVEMLIKEFISRSNNSQLFINTQDINLFNLDLLRRDEILLVEKENDGNTKLFCLADFSVRISDKVARDYLLGRYGAIPIIK